MKKFLLLFSCALGLVMFANTAAKAQCVPDSVVTSPGIYPDTLKDGCVGSSYVDAVSFVFPSDTTIATPFGNVTVDFDSFVVSSVTNVPAGLNYACNIPNCHYITVPGQLTRGCVDINGTPTDTTDVLDSIIVVGDAWVTIFGQATPFSDTFRLGLKVHPANDAKCGGAAIDPALVAGTGLEVYPNPLEAGSQAFYSLAMAAEVKIEVFDMMGRKAKDIYNGYQPAGDHAVKLYDESLPAGLFFVKLTLNNGKAVLTEKVVSVK